MIWFLLYPIRGTIKPQRLALNSPIRHTFQRLGTLVARHWLLTIVLSVAAAVSICYPSVFLYSHPAAGFNRIPRHVWASAKVFDNAVTIRPDVEVRQVWIHGNYMKALEKYVLQDALTIQNQLIGRGFNTTHGSGKEVDQIDKVEVQEPSNVADGFSACGYQLTQPLTWGFHSPLMHWNCSAAAIDSDNDVLSTINEQSTRKSYMNLTLRPTSVFAGKDWVKNNITAADTLVITLFDLAGSDAGSEWDKRLLALANSTSTRGHWYLPRGDKSKLYEFEFKSMSWNDGMLLLLSYTAMALYVLASLRKTRAVKSTLGLGVAIITELTVSVIASFTICGILNVDLTRIPREIYPFVVLTIGLENMFRLMNEVVATPGTTPTVQRISHALGNVGHLSLEVAAENLFILWLLSRVVAPSMRSFCVFAAIALVFDFVFHLTFFVAVLSVDVQRLELQDSLDRIRTNVSAKAAKSPKRPERQTWAEALRHGTVPFSTRIAGTAVSVCFVLAVNWHFFNNMTLLQMLGSLRFATAKQQSGYVFFSTVLPPINQRRTPAAWMRIQDHKTVEEVMQFVKPNGPSFVARIHQPVAVVLDGASRATLPGRSEPILSIIRDVLDEHLIPWSLTVVVIVGLTTILMNYLLWNEIAEEDEIIKEGLSDEPFHIGRLYRMHEHDIVKMYSCTRNLVTISSDRGIALQMWDPTQVCYRPYLVRTEYLSAPLWPVTAIAMNETAAWLAFLSKDGRVAACKTSNRRLKEISKIVPQAKPPLLFSFVPSQNSESDGAQLLILSSDGFLTEVNMGEGISSSSFQIIEDTVTQACMLPGEQHTLRLVVATKSKDLVISQKAPEGWITSRLMQNHQELSQTLGKAHAKAISRIPLLNLFFIATSYVVHIFDSSSHDLVDSVNVSHQIKASTLRVIHSPRRECPSCRAKGVSSLTTVYTDAENNDCILHTYQLAEGGSSSLICFSPSAARANTGCVSISEATVSIHIVSNPGSWDTTGAQSVMGIRKLETLPEPEPELIVERTSTKTSATDIPALAVRSRRLSRPMLRVPSSSRSQSTDVFEDFEIWTLSSHGDLLTQPLNHASVIAFHLQNGNVAPSQTEHEQLFAASVGPVRKLGKRSIAVAVANAVLTVTLGTEGRWEDGGAEEEYAALTRADLAWRRGREKAKKREE